MRIARQVQAGWLALLLFGCGGQGTGSEAGAPQQAAVAVDTEEHKIVYAIGLAVAQQNLGQLEKAFTPNEKAEIALGFTEQAEGQLSQVQLPVYGPRINPFVQKRMAAVEAAGEGAPQIQSEAGDDTLSYAIGMAIYQQNVGPLRVFFDDTEMRVLARGFADHIKGDSSLVVLDDYGPKINPLIQARVTAQAEEAKTAGKLYLENAAKEEGAVLTESGMVYKEQVAGSGPSPKADSKVTVHYTGMLIDGTVFDSSVQRGEPLANYPLNQLIPGWIEGIQLMKAGGKAQLVIPSELAYGDAGSPPTIPGGATLVFEVELLSFE